MKNVKILWVDDEIEFLRSHIIFLKEKGFFVSTANNGEDAKTLVSASKFDIIFLDENMPGLSGLQTLNEIKLISPETPVVMVTKSEAEEIMDKAIGSKISDYLIKPVNPNQILLAIKKNVDNKRLITESTTSAYQSEFNKLGRQIGECRDYKDWITLYKKLIFWELELEKVNDNTLDDILKMQKNEANASFGKFVKNNYLKWFEPNAQDKPLMSNNIFRNKIFPVLEKNEKVVAIIIDNLRYDHWKALQTIINEFFVIDEDEIFYSILPTATQYARNAMFSGLMPSEIEKLYPGMWLNDEDEGRKNLFEEELLKKQMARMGKNYKMTYVKALNNRDGKRIVDNISSILQNQLIVLVYNFVDLLSHARTEVEMIRELAEDEAAYRSLVLSWFEHSPLLELLKIVAENGIKVVITTDHGTVKVQNAVKVIGDKHTSVNLRYKQGRTMNYDPRDVFEITNPAKAFLPKQDISSAYIFAMGYDFFAYPNNFNYYAKYYRNTFQHGGISMEEMLIPVALLSPKS